MFAGIESSVPALALAESNAQLNGWRPSQYTLQKNDIVKYMQHQIAQGALWDLVVLDPPKLAPSRKSLHRALSKYCKLNTLVGIMLSQLESQESSNAASHSVLLRSGFGSTDVQGSKPAIEFASEPCKLTATRMTHAV